MYDEHCGLVCLDAPRAEAIRSVLPDAKYARRLADRASEVTDHPWMFSCVTRLVVALALLEGGELCVCDLSWVTGRTQDYLTHHLNTLRSQGLAGSRREGDLVMYSLTEEGTSLLCAVLEQLDKPMNTHTEGTR